MVLGWALASGMEASATECMLACIAVLLDPFSKGPEGKHTLDPVLKGPVGLHAGVGVPGQGLPSAVWTERSSESLVSCMVAA